MDSWISYVAMGSLIPCAVQDSENLCGEATDSLKTCDRVGCVTSCEGEDSWSPSWLRDSSASLDFWTFESQGCDFLLWEGDSCFYL